MDVDYSFKGKGQIHGAEVMVSEDEIRTLLDLQEGLMSHVVPRPLRGMTIALEPTYCGGAHWRFSSDVDHLRDARWSAIKWIGANRRASVPECESIT